MSLFPFLCDIYRTIHFKYAKHVINEYKYIPKVSFKIVVFNQLLLQSRQTHSSVKFERFCYAPTIVVKPGLTDPVAPAKY